MVAALGAEMVARNRAASDWDLSADSSLPVTEHRMCRAPRTLSHTITTTCTSQQGQPVLMTVALMWEARAVEGRGAELLEWARAQEPARREPLRREILRAPGDRVLVITWWDAAYDAELPELPEPERSWWPGRCTGGGSKWWVSTVRPGVVRVRVVVVTGCDDGVVVGTP